MGALGSNSGEEFGMSGHETPITGFLLNGEGLLLLGVPNTGEAEDLWPRLVYC